MISKSEQKFITSLKVKKYRAREKRFLVEGAKNVQELLKSDFEVELVLATSDYMSNLGDVRQTVRVEEVGEKLLSTVGTFKSNASTLAVVRFRPEEKATPTIDKSTFVLDGVGDPGNLGTIIRTLDWFGHDQVICSQDCAEFYNPKVIASTMGSFTRIKVHYVDLVDFIGGTSLPSYAMDMNGTSLEEASIQNPALIVMGSESHGISTEVRALVDEIICIPGYGDAESLNVGIATGIVAHHLRAR